MGQTIHTLFEAIEIQNNGGTKHPLENCPSDRSEKKMKLNHESNSNMNRKARKVSKVSDMEEKTVIFNDLKVKF